MDEKEIIKSTHAYDAKGISVLIFFISLIADFTMLIIYSLIKCPKGIYQRYNQLTGTWSTHYREWTPLCILDAFKKLVVPVILILVIGIVLAFAVGKFKSELTVTDKRVYGMGVFGKRVDISLDSISAIDSLSFFKGISIKTSSESIKFFGMKNCDDIYDILNKLLEERRVSV